VLAGAELRHAAACRPLALPFGLAAPAAARAADRRQMQEDCAACRQKPPQHGEAAGRSIGGEGGGIDRRHSRRIFR
jgi:hypothetical protein